MKPIKFICDIIIRALFACIVMGMCLMFLLNMVFGITSDYLRDKWASLKESKL